MVGGFGAFLQLFEQQNAEHDRRESTRAKPPDETFCRCIESRPAQSYGDGNHANNRQTRKRSNNDRRAELAERIANEEVAKDEEGDCPEKLTSIFGELRQMLGLFWPGHVRLVGSDPPAQSATSECEPGAERCDEAVSTERSRPAECDYRQCERGDLFVASIGPTSRASPPQDPDSAKSDQRASKSPETDLLGNETDP